MFRLTQVPSLGRLNLLALCFGFMYSGVMTSLVISVPELTPLQRRGGALGVVVLLSWIGMGTGGFQGGRFFDLTGSYTLPFANAAGAGPVNLAIVGALLLLLARRGAQALPAGAA